MTFAEWLLRQSARPDEVGRLARALADDQAEGCDQALVAETYQDLHIHLLFDHELDPRGIEALAVAHAEWPGARAA